MVAHPRVCGENAKTCCVSIGAQGSSPRMRGKPQGACRRRGLRGLIPAYAGKTPIPAARLEPAWAHPRVCGENDRVGAERALDDGSSPRMRGKQTPWEPFPHQVGLIPAYAGKTCTRARVCALPSAHPRVCGENCGLVFCVFLSSGSSPRMRGKLVPIVTALVTRGLIPAYAGKTERLFVSKRGAWAHPRVCGENPERSGVLTLRSVRSWKTLSFPSSLKVTHCRAFVQLSLSRIRL